MYWTIKKFLCCFNVIIIVLLAGGCRPQTPEVTASLKEEEKAETEPELDPEVPETTLLVVYVCGEVLHPGVYELPAGSRLYQAIEAAGGLTETAADTYLNQAEPLADGQSVYVPTPEEAESEGGPPPGAGMGAGSSDETKVNINTAGKEELMTLTGIGEAKALSIIEYRTTNGQFGAIEEIKNIPGIKDGVFQKIKDQISI